MDCPQAEDSSCLRAIHGQYQTKGESGDAGAGGHAWASTYLEVPRTLNAFGDFATVTNGVIFHNTLAPSDYGYLKHGTFVPRPSYFAALLWNRLMGHTVYASGEKLREGAHVYAHSRKDSKEGIAYLSSTIPGQKLPP